MLFLTGSALFYPQDVDVFVDAEASHFMEGTAEIILADIKLLGKAVQRERFLKVIGNVV